MALYLVDGFNLLHAVVLKGKEREQWWCFENQQKVVQLAKRFVPPPAAGAAEATELGSTESGAATEGLTTASVTAVSVATAATTASEFGTTESSEDDGAEIVVVFDAKQDYSARFAVETAVRVLFAPSADQLIVDEVRRTKALHAGRRVVVVSSDRALLDRSRHYGAERLSPRIFASHCADDSSVAAP